MTTGGRAVKAGGEQARTRSARRAVIEAAAVEFDEHGYGATSIDAISRRAAVPPATVYRLFHSKIGILRAWLDVAIGGDDAPVAVADRPHVAALHTEVDPKAVISRFVGIATAINARSNGSYRILVGAAETDPAAAALLRDIQRQRAAGQRGVTRALARLGSLRVSLTERRAADLVHVLASPETYRALVVDRRWSARSYRTWLEQTLRQQLLD